MGSEHRAALGAEGSNNPAAGAQEEEERERNRIRQRLLRQNRDEARARERRHAEKSDGEEGGEIMENERGGLNLSRTHFPLPTVMHRVGA